MKEQKKFFIEGTKIPVMVTDYDWTYAALHWHSYWEILMQTEGRTEVVIGKETFVSEEGNITIVQPNQIHATRKISDKANILLLQFETSVLMPVMDFDIEQKYISLLINGGYFVKNRVEMADCREIAEDLYQLLESQKGKRDGYEFEMYARILHLFSTLIRKKYLDIPKLEDDRNNAFLAIRPAILFIEQNYSKKISQQEMAQLCHLSLSHFSRQFKKAVGASMVDYINRIRLKEAVRMLKTETTCIYEISAATGFSSVNYFNKVFKKRYGVSPRVYRAK